MYSVPVSYSKKEQRTEMNLQLWAMKMARSQEYIIRGKTG